MDRRTSNNQLAILTKVHNQKNLSKHPIYRNDKWGVLIFTE